jgi:hypothetical protein
MFDELDLSLATISAVASFGAFRLLDSGLHSSIPLSDPTNSIGAGLAVLAFVGVFANSYAHEVQKNGGY